MVKLKNPLLSLGARGLVGAISYVRRRHTNIAEKTPIPKDAKTSEQLAWRTMYQLCVDLWHTLSAAEKLDWESAARSRHMTGYAWYLSQCLRPNPGIYLPLAGGTMTGEILMGTNSIKGLPLPTGTGHATRKSYVDGSIAAVQLGEYVKVYASADFAAPDAAWGTVPFDQELWDTDGMHSNVTNNSRLTANTSGFYFILAQGRFAPHAAGIRTLAIRLDGATIIAYVTTGLRADNVWAMTVSTTWRITVGSYVEMRVYQTSGAPLNLLNLTRYSPIFQMVRTGL